MFKKILLELTGESADGDALTLLQELIDSRDLERVLLIRRIRHGPVSVADFPLDEEAVLEKDRKKEIEASEYLTAVERFIHWRKVPHDFRVEYADAGLTMGEFARQEGFDLVLLPAGSDRGLLRWFWRRLTGRVERAGALPLVFYGRRERSAPAA